MKETVEHFRLPANAYPFSILALDTRDNSVVWRRVVTGPESLKLPPIARRIGVKIRIIWPNGSATAN